MKFNIDAVEIIEILNSIDFNDKRLTDILNATRECKQEFEFKDTIENLDSIEVYDFIHTFYQSFCDKCKNMYGCNYCPAYAFNAEYGFDDKLEEEDVNDYDSQDDLYSNQITLEEYIRVNSKGVKNEK